MIITDFVGTGLDGGVAGPQGSYSYLLKREGGGGCARAHYDPSTAQNSDVFDGFGIPKTSETQAYLENIGLIAESESAPSPDELGDPGGAQGNPPGNTAGDFRGGPPRVCMAFIK